MSHLQRLILVIGLFAISACSQSPVVVSETSAPPSTKTVTPHKIETETAPIDLTPLPTFSFANTALPTLTPLPTFALPVTPVFQPTLVRTPPLTPLRLPATPVFQPIPVRTPQVLSGLTFDQINPIFYGKSLLGATFGDNWFSAREVYPLLGKPQVYDFYDQTFQLFQATAVVLEPPLGGAYQCGWLGVQFVDEGIGDISPVLGVKPGQSVIFRPVQKIANDSDLYEQYLQEWLLLQGFQSPELGIKNILLVDLEGDGVDEVILAATNIENSMGGLHMAGAGKYSVVLMRKVI